MTASTSVTSGTLKASQVRTNRAALSDASMSSTPASTAGCCATTPTDRPSTLASPHTTFRAQCSCTSVNEPASTEVPRESEEGAAGGGSGWDLPGRCLPAHRVALRAALFALCGGLVGGVVLLVGTLIDERGLPGLLVMLAVFLAIAGLWSAAVAVTEQVGQRIRSRLVRPLVLAGSAS